MTRPLVSHLMTQLPELTSCLYDLDLMPEQVASGSKQEWKMFCIAAHFDKMRRRLIFPAAQDPAREVNGQKVGSFTREII